MEVMPGYKQTETGLIPCDWLVRPVGLMGEVVTGKALAVNAPGEQRPYLRTKNVFDGRIDIDDVLKMPMTDAQFQQFMLKKGDVLLNEGQSLELVGRCALYQDEYPAPCAIQNQLLRFRARQGVSGIFASHLFRHCQQTGVFARIALQTTSIAHLGGKRFEQLLLQWPSTEDEQRAIATALSDVDALLGGLDRLIAKKRHLKQAAMQQLLTGQTRLPGFSGKWEVKTLDQIAFVTSGKRLPLGSSLVDVPTPHPYILVTDMRPGTVDTSELMYVPESVFPAIKQYRIYQADIFISVAGSLGIVGKVPAELDGANLTENADRITDIRCSQDYLLYVLLSPLIQNVIDSIRTVGAQPKLALARIRKFEIPIPPSVAEQTAIAAILSDMDAELAALEARRAKTRNLKQAMIQ